MNGQAEVAATMAAVQDRVETVFCAAYLSLVEDICLSTLTRSLRNDIPTLCSPNWSHASSEALAFNYEKWLDALGVAIKRIVFPFSRASKWSSRSAAIDQAFGISRYLHLFRTEHSIERPTFTEPQFTKDFTHFLNSSDPAKRTKGVRAMLKAPGTSELAGDWNEIKVSAERNGAGRLGTVLWSCMNAVCQTTSMTKSTTNSAEPIGTKPDDPRGGPHCQS